MEKTSTSTIVYFMNEIIKACMLILPDSKKELSEAEKGMDEARIKAIKLEVAMLEEIIEDAEAIAYDTDNNKLGKGTPLLLKRIAANIKRMLYVVANKKSLHSKHIVTRFKEANMIMNDESEKEKS